MPRAKGNAFQREGQAGWCGTDHSALPACEVRGGEKGGLRGKRKVGSLAGALAF